MKKINSFIVASLAVIALIATACNSEDAKKDAPAGKAKAAKTEVNLPNYRYVDLDSVLSKYNLAKDYNEEMLRMQTNMESAAKRHEKQNPEFCRHHAEQNAEQRLSLRSLLSSGRADNQQHAD